MAVSEKKAVKRVTRIGVMSTGVTLAALYAILGLIYGLIYAAIIAVIGTLFSGYGGTTMGFAAMGVIGAVIMIVVLPIVFAICGFIAGALTAILYNFVVKYTGGIAFEVTG